MGLRLEIKIPSLDKFYEESNIVEDTGSKSEWELCDKRDDRSWVGLSREDVEKSMYSYKEGLDKLKAIELDVPLGGSKKTYKWDDNDGDEMSLDRLYDYLPAMRKRLKSLGKGNGKFITIHTNIDENACVGFKEMLNRSYAVIQLVDFLENQGYRVAVAAYTDVKNPGKYKEQSIEFLHLEIIVKNAEEPLNKGLLLTAISPWFFRIHIFKFWNCKFKMDWGYGSSVEVDYKDSESDIYFRVNSCLTAEASELYVKKMRNKFEDDKDNVE